MAGEQWWSGYVPGVVGSTAPTYTFVVQGVSKVEVAAKEAASQHTVPADVIVFGPYPDQAQAQARLAEAHVGGPGSPTYQQQIGSAIPGLGALGEIGHFTGELVTHLTDAHMWISLGWLLLGLLLLVIGILLWVKADVPKLLGVPGAG